MTCVGTPASRAISMPKAESATPGTMACRKPARRRAARSRSGRPRIGLPFFEPRQLVVVGGEQRARADRVVQVLDDRPGDGQAVVGAGAAADLVQDDQERSVAWWRMVAVSIISTMNVRLAAREVVVRADAGEDAVDQPDAAPRRPARTSRSAPAARSAPPGAGRSILPAMFGPVISMTIRPSCRRAQRRSARTRRAAGCARPPGAGRRRSRCAGSSPSARPARSRCAAATSASAAARRSCASARGGRAACARHTRASRRRSASNSSLLERRERAPRRAAMRVLGSFSSGVM